MNEFWESWQRPYRHAIVAAIRALGPMESVLEGGCHCGPNLRLLRAEMPHLTLAGFDRSPEFIALGQALLPSDVKLEVSDWKSAVIDGLRADVLLSVYSLSYVAPDVLPDLLTYAATLFGALMFAEPLPTETEPAGRVEGAQWGDADTPEYRHDYEAVLRRIGVARSQVERCQIPRWGRLNGLLTVRTR